jgi:hypothetical protein
MHQLVEHMDFALGRYWHGIWFNSEEHFVSINSYILNSLADIRLRVVRV